MKVARPVWSGGKGGDNFKTLPIAIVPLHKNAQCRRLVHFGSAEIFGYVYEVPVYGRVDRRARHHFRDRYPGQQQHDGALHHDAVSPVRHVAAERADPFRQLGFNLW